MATSAASSTVASTAPHGEGAARTPFPPDFPKVVVQQPWGGSAPVMRSHHSYQAAKAGDVGAAFLYVRDLMTSAKLDALRAMIGDRLPAVVAVHAEEATGRNAIPATYATVLGRELGLPIDEAIVQASRARRTGSSNLYRILTPVKFDGPVIPGQDYLIVDDHVSQGGTLADLRSYIERKGGVVVGASTLTAIPDGEMLAASAATLEGLRARLPGIVGYWQEARGHDIEGLTEHEARYLLRFNTVKSLRNQLAAGPQASNRGGRGGDLGESEGGEGGQGGGRPAGASGGVASRE